MILTTAKHKVPFQIDDEDYDLVSRYTWHLVRGYPASTCIVDGAVHKCLYLHHLLLGKAPPGLEWDHINRDPLDNRRANLRAVTHAKNLQNASRRRDNDSGVRGVHRAKNLWRASIGGGKRCVVLGRFRTKEEAIQARRDAEAALGWNT